MSAPVAAPSPAPAPPGAPAAPSSPTTTMRPSWWRRNRFLTLAVTAFLALTLLSWALADRTSDRPLAPDNPDPDGARAAAEILRREGVRVQEATSLAEVGRLAGPDTTVLVTEPRLLAESQREELAATGADLVIAGDPFGRLEGFGAPLTPAGAGSSEPLSAGCTDPDAAAADTISFTRGSAGGPAGEGVVVCFPVADGTGGYAVWSDGTRTVRYLADPRLMTNEHLADDGNAALALRALGHDDSLVWFMPSPFDATAPTDRVPLVPPATTAALAVLAAAALVLALARGRALGPVVTEIMPVVVRSAETTRGRGRLYRRSGAHDHAAAGLRAGTASRLARTLGLPRSAEPTELVAAVARATGADPLTVRDLLYGPAPTDDRSLLRLSARLDALESEVHRT